MSICRTVTCLPQLEPQTSGSNTSTDRRLWERGALPRGRSDFGHRYKSRTQLELERSSSAGLCFVSGVSMVRTMTTDREEMLLQSHSAAFLNVFIWSSFITCLHLYNQKPRNPKETSLNLLWGPDCVDSCIVIKLKSTLQRLG